jgi:4-hydroxymandelate oxidase
MGPIEKQWCNGLSRRAALRSLAGFLATSPLLGQQDPFRDHSRVPSMDELLTTFDFEAVAFAKLPAQTYHYSSHGTQSEYTLRRNREAFDWVKLVPRAVVDVSAVDASTEVLGAKMKFPVMLAPSSGHGALHREGEVATHRGASAASGTPMILSSGASARGEEILKAGSGPMWFQLYGREKFEENLPLVEGVQAAGYTGVVLTVDQTAAYYERVQHMQHLTGRSNRGAARSRRARGAAREEEPTNPKRRRI